jgi:hypothetical protein
MSVPAVIQLQEYATDEAHDVSELLRKALLVATKLKLTDFREWLSHELNGYDDKPSVPQYRTIRGELRVQNPYHGLVPFLIEDGELAEMVCKVHVTESVAALRNLIAQSGPGRTVAFTFPPEAEAVLMRMQDGFAPLRPLRVVGTNQLTSVINTVRNRVLEWALALEEEGIVGDGLSFSREEKTIAASNPNIRIDNFQGILGDVHQSRVTQENRLVINSGSFDSLARYLKSQGVPDDDVDSLELAIRDDPDPTNERKFGERVSAWMGKMVTKAADGTWNVGVGAAGGLLAAALSKFYGM